MTVRIGCTNIEIILDAIDYNSVNHCEQATKMFAGHLNQNTF